MAALLQTRGRNWIQESYETGDPSIKTRAKQLRSRGYRVATSSMGPQVTQYGVVKMTLLDVRPGTSGDEYLEQVNPSKRKVRRRVAKALKKYVRGNPRAGSKAYWIAYRDEMYGEYIGYESPRCR